MILADSSAWVEFDRATGSAVDVRLAVTEPVEAEVRSGARTDDREFVLRRLLARCTLLPVDSVSDFDGAVRFYRRCRGAGVTPRGIVDCMIAAVALRHDVSVLAFDVDMARIADVMPLRLDAASPRPRA